MGFHIDIIQVMDINLLFKIIGIKSNLQIAILRRCFPKQSLTSNWVLYVDFYSCTCETLSVNQCIDLKTVLWNL